MSNGEKTEGGGLSMATAEKTKFGEIWSCIDGITETCAGNLKIVVEAHNKLLFQPDDKEEPKEALEAQGSLNILIGRLRSIQSLCHKTRRFLADINKEL